MWESDTGFLDIKMCEKAFAQWVDYTGKNKHYLTESHINTWQAHYSPITQCKPSFMEHPWTVCPLKKDKKEYLGEEGWRIV